ncbi:MAG: Tex family protein [Clostridia bacterium]|jgi:uncharacterized protein
MMDIIKVLAEELKIRESQVRSTVALIDDGNTIPFVARYRKEVTGGLDDTILRDLYDRLNYLRNLENRKEEVIRLIDEQGKMTDELREKILRAVTMQEVEDLYLPFRPKRRTRATVAKEKGLEPLAEILWQQEICDGLDEVVRPFVNNELGIESPEEALAGARDIMAEWISENSDFRKMIREHTLARGVLVSRQVSEEKSVYEMYYDYQEAVRSIVPHRILAINRGEREKFLTIKIDVNVDQILSLLREKLIQNENSAALDIIVEAIEDSYKRLIAPSIEREIRNLLTEKAEEQAIRIFAANLRNLLLQPPVRNSVVLGLDPGYRTGCKVAVVDETGKVLDTAVVYITLPKHDVEQGKEILRDLIKKYKVDIVAIGNGTASKESEIVVAELLKELDREIYYMVVSEAGASVYSASKLSAEEFPVFDVALRSAVSIARRLQDPLAELVKIDPKAIGVGQYQHDVDQKRLAETLAGVVEFCVNNVGVDLNTASSSLLQYVSGINGTVAKNIVAYREENGKFKNRKELLKVKKLGAKTFQQCAGFLRIIDGNNILDNTAVHPESYPAALELLALKGYSLEDVGKEGLKGLQTEIRNWNLEELADQLNVGIPTLEDILEELQKPGRDPRDELPRPLLRTDVMDIKDLKPDMVLTGTVRNVTDFGAFVDIGVHQDGLVRISQLSDRYVKHPMEAVQVGDIVKVKILEVDVERKRIALTMKGIL